MGFSDKKKEQNLKNGIGFKSRYSKIKEQQSTNTKKKEKKMRERKIKNSYQSWKSVLN